MASTFLPFANMILRTVGPAAFWSSSPTLATFTSLGGRVCTDDRSTATHLVTSFALFSDDSPLQSTAFAADLRDYHSAVAQQKALNPRLTLLDMATFKDMVMDAHQLFLQHQKGLKSQVEHSLLASITSGAPAAYVGL